MIRALFSAASGMVAQQLNIDNVANNLANSNTTGFKRRRVQFQDLLYQNLVSPGTSSGQQTVFPSGLQLGLGARVVSNETIFQQGDFLVTENPLDVVIEGAGFFQVVLPTGNLAYTRAGSFHLDQNGNIVTSTGNPIEPNIVIPRNALDVTIGQDGTVSYNIQGQAQASQAGVIQIAAFQNPAGLKALGGNLFTPTTASGDPILGQPGLDGIGAVRQGMLENSNVSVVEEFIQMIMGQRAYEANARVVRAADEMHREANQLSQ
ncbi:MAG: flagellar basal-body rod protein FlgG [Acidobacteria bacterium]|nr:flagellar basal-body rod protein FlgG [Acidobacteriota bacterium]